MSAQVWKKVRRIQREFLWGGTSRAKKINWVKWSLVCKSKEVGGLGVRDVRLVNINLLTKWRWRLLESEDGLWKDVIRSKYGDATTTSLFLGVEVIPWYASTWWRDICSMGINLNINLFAQQMVRKFGNGEMTSFWYSTWLGDMSLKDNYPRLFSISDRKETTVRNVLGGVEGTLDRNLSWRRRLFVLEEVRRDVLLAFINGVLLSVAADVWEWRPQQGSIFTVNSTHRFIVNMLSTNTTYSHNKGSQQEKTFCAGEWCCRICPAAVFFVMLRLKIQYISFYTVLTRQGYGLAKRIVATRKRAKSVAKWTISDHQRAARQLSPSDGRRSVGHASTNSPVKKCLLA
ncbi:hypothetical protein TSUD_362640 [Trifolium subterraneum]|uniref:Reverse transcriptase zinc-binding domain-containing protein n=1 Tax=Trifolium subterraneum TaxID=3900 RepID=A0A2Z6MVB4_TRISU|nr:hypothetical protein TSUD_362640 [Trifolium subterraneum]